jgi:hypothetical protein
MFVVDDQKTIVPLSRQRVGIVQTTIRKTWEEDLLKFPLWSLQTT